MPFKNSIYWENKWSIKIINILEIIINIFIRITCDVIIGQGYNGEKVYPLNMDAYYLKIMYKKKSVTPFRKMYAF